MKQKMIWVSRYISRPIIVLVFILFILYKFFPSVYTKMGISLETVATYSVYFFAVKGILWLVVIGYSIYYIRNKKKNKSASDTNNKD
jgi:hypothetical protein